MLTAILFILVIGVLIFVHELGHFLVAKKAGMRVDEFGFGFPPRLWGIKRGETIYSLNWIPFGGFVKIYGEDGDDRSEPRSFGSKSFSARMAVILAGVAMNFLFAGVLLGFGNYVGLRIALFDDNEISEARDKQIQVISVSADSPASDADIQTLDDMRGYIGHDGKQVLFGNIQELQDYVNGNHGKAVSLVVARAGVETVKEVKLREKSPEGQGLLGISMALTGIISRPWYVSIWKGFYDAAILTYNTAYGFLILIQGLFTEGRLIADISGPVGIGKLTGQAARIGFSYLMQFVAIISVNLAVMNVIPFPALDGGRAFLLVVEKIKGSPLRRRTEAIINTAGFLILISLMLLVTARDLVKLF